LTNPYFIFLSKQLRTLLKQFNYTLESFKLGLVNETQLERFKVWSDESNIFLWVEMRKFWKINWENGIRYGGGPRMRRVRKFKLPFLRKWS
jgi:hypothetical protein